MIIADTLASYGSMARFTDVNRIHKVNGTTVIGAGGEYSDFQSIQHILHEATLEDFQAADRKELSPSEVHSYLTKVLYSHRSKVEPLYNQVLVAGFSQSQPFLGYSDLYGSSFKDNVAATGFGMYLAMPILRNAWRPDLTAAEAQAALEDCMRVLYYRDARALNKVVLARADASGVSVSPAYSLPTQWEYSRFVSPHLY
jgi:20S proteasome subunit beta 7